MKGWYARPASGGFNNSIFIINHTCYGLDNQRVSSCFDTGQATYSYHENLIAAFVIPNIDQTCSGLSVSAINGVDGFVSNPPLTNETFYMNTWSRGWNRGYFVQSNHPHGINMHTSCSQNTASITVTSSLYGGIFDHFQDIHNAHGITFNCTSPGTRYDIRNMITENAGSGAFVRVNNATETTPGNCVGTVGITTSNLDNSAVQPFFVAGSGANMRVNESDRILIPGLVTSNFTSAATTGTSKQTLATYTIPYNGPGGTQNTGLFQNNSGGVVRIKTWGITAANTNSKTFEIDFGGTAIATITTGATTTSGTVRCEAEIIVSSVANTQEVTGQCFYDDGTTRTSNTIRTAPGITGSAAIVLNVAATTASASGDLTFKGLTIEYVGGQ